MKRFFNVKSIVLGLIAISLIISGTTFISCKKQPKEIKIGAILPLTGGAGKYGEDAKLGIDLAVNEINLQGGIICVSTREHGFLPVRLQAILIV